MSDGEGKDSPPERKVHKCPYNGCEYSSTHFSSLRQHLAYIHDEGVRWFHCDLCDYKAKKNGTVRRHKADVHNIDVVWYPCSYAGCNYKAKQKSHMKRHVQVVHVQKKLDQWKFCSYCTFRTKSQKWLMRHMEQHWRDNGGRKSDHADRDEAVGKGIPAPRAPKERLVESVGQDLAPFSDAAPSAKRSSPTSAGQGRISTMTPGPNDMMNRPMIAPVEHNTLPINVPMDVGLSGDPRVSFRQDIPAAARGAMRIPTGAVPSNVNVVAGSEEKLCLPGYRQRSSSLKIQDVPLLQRHAFGSTPMVSGFQPQIFTQILQPEQHPMAHSTVGPGYPIPSSDNYAKSWLIQEEMYRQQQMHRLQMHRLQMQRQQIQRQQIQLERHETQSRQLPHRHALGALYNDSPPILQPAVPRIPEGAVPLTNSEPSDSVAA